MPNGHKLYVFNPGSGDPLRADLNSYWIGDEFAKQKSGDPNLMSPNYGPADTTDDAQYFYKTRQKIKVTKQNAFDAAQSSVSFPAGAATKALQNISNASSPASKALTLPGGLQAGLANNTFSSQKGPGASLSGQNIAQVGSTSDPLTFPEYFETHFFNFIFDHSDASKPAEDIVFQTETPIVTKDFSTTSDPGMGKDEVKEEFLINFLQKQYEIITSSPSVSELQLPLFYKTVNNMLSDSSYFNNYVKDGLPSSDSKYENVVFPMDNYDDLQALNSYGMRYPLEVRLNPSNKAFGNPANVSKALQDSSLDCVFFENVAFRASATAAVIVNKTFQKNNLKVENPIDSSTTTDAVLETSTVTLESMNATTFGRNISSFTEGKRTEFAGLGDATYLGPAVLSTDMASGNASSLQEILASATFLGRLKDLVFKNLRSFEDINMGKKSYSEIVFYKVEKYSSFEAPTPVQSFWIPNVASESPLEYIDTQVKYNKEYYYRVFAYSAVIGTKYYYDLSTLAATFKSPAQLAQEPIDLALSSAELNYFTLLNLRKDYEVMFDSLTDEHGAIYSNLDAWINGTQTSPWPRDLEFEIVRDQGNFKKGDITNSGAMEDLARIYFPVRDSTYNGYDHGDILRAYEAWQKAVDDKNQLQVSNIFWKTVPPDINTPLGASEHFEVDVVSMPCVQFIKTNLFDFNGSILDDPPMIPQVDFTSYIGVDNKIMINMLGQVGEYKSMPVIMSTEESNYIDSLRAARGMPPDSMITYKTDDEILGFNVYRIDFAPSSYEDFSIGKTSFASTEHRNSFEAIFSWSSSFKDTIIPNKDYYYMVRSVDIHNHSSYPSPIYKVRLVNDSGAIYPLIEVVEVMEVSNPKMKMKKFKKFMKLSPKLPHKMIDYVASGLLSSDGFPIPSALGHENSIELGVVEPKLFGKEGAAKTFKIRLTSRQTGKKLDLNVTFKVKNEDQK
jgi:hypothetical protein